LTVNDFSLLLEACLMTRIKYLVVILLVMMAATCSDTRQGQSVDPLADNQENRTAMAKRYLEVMPPKEMLQGWANRMVRSLPENNRKAFMEVIQSSDIEKEAHRITLEALVKHFTAGELNAMVTFYGSPEGKSAVKKFGPLMGEVMPQIQQEVRKTLAATQKQPESKEPPKTTAPPAPPAPPGPKEQKTVPGKK